MRWIDSPDPDDDSDEGFEEGAVETTEANSNFRVSHQPLHAYRERQDEWSQPHLPGNTSKNNDATDTGFSSKDIAFAPGDECVKFTEPDLDRAGGHTLSEA